VPGSKARTGGAGYRYRYLHSQGRIQALQQMTFCNIYRMTAELFIAMAV